MKYNWNDGWSFWKEGSNEKKSVRLPHDAMICELRGGKNTGGSSTGYFPGGVYYYEKKFQVTKAQLEQCITVEFEGAYKNAEVYLNGTKIHQGVYGYIPFFVSFSNFLQEGENTLLVKTDNAKQPDSRWYSGAGIYRPVWLHIQPKEHIEIEGVQIRTQSLLPTVISIGITKTSGYIDVEIWDADGELVVSKDHIDTEADIAIPNAKLWSADTPYLYSAKVKLFSEAGEPLDEVEESFGVRMISWSPEGFFVNGKNTLLRGGCVHHDNGILGACTYEESEERRIRILKENGFNAIRCAHNPCSKAVLQACDKLGMYVIDESWDMWYNRKNKYDYAVEFMEHYLDDLRAMVRRDFNHPSVIMYSIGNELSEPAVERGVALSQQMSDYVRGLDPTRAVTGGFNLTIIKSSKDGRGIYKEEGGRDDSNDKRIARMNSTMFNMLTHMIGSGMNKAANGKDADIVTSPVLATVDIAGYNYASGRYQGEGKLHPERIIVGSETFPQDIAKNWKMVQEIPYLIGDFMWTSWDYIGEVGLGAWTYHEDAKGFEKPYPWLLADTGAFDILGNPTGEAMLAKAVWGYANKPLIAVQPCHQPKKTLIKASWRGTNAIPSWSWSGCEGNRVIVEVYSDAFKVELFLNGHSFGKKKVKDNKTIFKLKYAPGTLVAVAYDKFGKEQSRNSIASAIHPSLKVVPEKDEVCKGSLVYVDVMIADEQGIVESNADRKIKCTVEGGTLLGFGSANPRTEESFDSGEYTTYYGYAQAVVFADTSETIKVTATDKVGSTIAEIKVR